MHDGLKSARAKEQDAFRLQYFARNRSWLERSINHPFFGVYPASYMWGKIAPELIRFVAKEPFGIKTGAAAYSLADVQTAMAAQREFDPEFDKQMEKLGHSQAVWFAGYLLPSVPWDIGSAMPAWMRSIAQQGVSAPSTELFSELARRFGADSLALIIDPNDGGGAPLSRDRDTNPYWGGARITSPDGGGCSDAFAWIIGSGTTGNAMLTAGHCAHLGGNITINGTIIGSVTANSEENWNKTGGGTQYYTGQTTYRGDAAIIRIKSGLSSYPKMYRGSVTSTTGSYVVSSLKRLSFVDENVYFSGGTSGETGLYHINIVGTNYRYTTGCTDPCYARNIVLASATTSVNPCVAGGDSGGAIFSPVTGGVRAVGTLSGRGPSPCDIVFTDIYNSYLALPGDTLLH